MTAFGVVTNDLLDLLVSGAVEYLILTNLTAAAFTDTTGGTGIVATPTEAGALLRDEHVAALRWRGSRGRDVLELPVDLVQYVHRPVNTLDPVEVLKACHTYEQLACDSPGWSASTARRLTDAIARAAARRVPGYAAAPVMWSRLRGRAIGLARRWRPVDGPAVMWLDPTAFAAQWAGAAQVLITLEALPDLPAGLGTRPHVFALTDAWPSPSQWQRLKASPATALVTCPTGLGWLRELLAGRVTS